MDLVFSCMARTYQKQEGLRRSETSKPEEAFQRRPLAEEGRQGARALSHRGRRHAEPQSRDEHKKPGINCPLLLSPELVWDMRWNPEVVVVRQRTPSLTRGYHIKRRLISPYPYIGGVGTYMQACTCMGRTYVWMHGMRQCTNGTDEKTGGDAPQKLPFESPGTNPE